MIRLLNLEDRQIRREGQPQKDKKIKILNLDSRLSPSELVIMEFDQEFLGRQPCGVGCELP